MATRPNRNWTSQRRSKLAFALSLLRPTILAIFMNNVLYSNITYLVRDNIKCNESSHSSRF
jgi:hypothetical protein